MLELPEIGSTLWLEDLINDDLVSGVVVSHCIDGFVVEMMLQGYEQHLWFSTRGISHGGQFHVCED